MLNAGPAPQRELQVKMAIFPGFDMPAERLLVLLGSLSPLQEQSTSRRGQRFTLAHCFSVVLNSKFRSKAGILAMEIRELQVNANVQRWLDL